MKFRYLFSMLAVATFGCLGLSPALGAEPPVAFSADAVQVTPKGQTRTARMYVSHGKVRMEYSTRGRKMIQILDADRKTSVMVMPDRHAYMVMNAGQQANNLQHVSPGPRKSPCAGVPAVQCRLLGTETLFGRKTEKWEMVRQYQGKTYKTTYWIDVERRTPIRQIWPDGTVTEMKPVGRETLNGRQTEKWLVTTRPAKGQPSHSYQWYDPQLQMAIREELPGGYYRELRNIQVGPQPQSLFQVPAGYQRIRAPAPQQGYRPGTQQAGQPVYRRPSGQRAPYYRGGQR